MPPRKSADLLQGTLDMLILHVAAAEPIHGYAYSCSSMLIVRGPCRT
jgi:hypothetical protein